MAGQSVLNELILEPRYNDGPRDWKNFIMSGFFSCILLLLG